MSEQKWHCEADRSSPAPQDCDAPYCGCNPEWPKVFEMLQEENIELINGTELESLRERAAALAGVRDPEAWIKAVRELIISAENYANFVAVLREVRAAEQPEQK